MRHTLRQWALTERSTRYKVAFVAVAFLIAFVLRLMLRGHLPSGYPYLTFFPAVILTTFFAGVRAGVIQAVLCGIAAWYWFVPPFNSLYLSGNTALALIFYVFIVFTDILLIAVMNTTLIRLEDERRLSDRLARSRELMFHELQHRVSNNLQVMASLLQLQRRDVSDPGAQAALDAASARLNVVSKIQRRLHDPDQQGIDFSRFLQEVVPDIVAAAGVEGQARYSLDLDPMPVTRDQAIPLALISTEFISNAIEHGMAGRDSVTISVRLKRQGEGAALEILDDGQGLPEGFDLARTRSLGLSIARQFATQLGGEMSMRTAGGTLARLDFPLDPGALDDTPAAERAGVPVSAALAMRGA